MQWVARLGGPGYTAYNATQTTWQNEETPVASLTVENYAKAIHQISARQNGDPATTGEIASALGVSPGTVTSMLKTLQESHLVSYRPYEGVALTQAGDALALRILRRHRLIELFLVKTLDLTWDEVHDEAEHMEHAVSDLLVDRIDSFLGHPTTDPHGDPIPSADGSVAVPDGRTLVECTADDEFAFSRILDQSPEFLRFLTDSGYSLGTKGRVVSNCIEAAVVTIEVDGKQSTLGREAAEKIQVTLSGN
jgi:DtxR family Mn-dependent transcriptional regulator